MALLFVWAEGDLGLTSEEAYGNVFPGQTQLWVIPAGVGVGSLA